MYFLEFFFYSTKFLASLNKSLSVAFSSSKSINGELLGLNNEKGIIFSVVREDKIRKVLDDAGVSFQTAELGKVDQGGGGTIAYVLANAYAPQWGYMVFLSSSGA